MLRRVSRSCMVVFIVVSSFVFSFEQFLLQHPHRIMANAAMMKVHFFIFIRFRSAKVRIIFAILQPQRKIGL